MNTGNNGSQFHDSRPTPASAIMPLPWPITISVMFIVPATISTTTRQKPIEIS